MSHPDEWQQVMLTHRVQGDRAGDDQLVISGVVGECGQVEGAGLNISAYARAIRAGVAAKLSCRDPLRALAGTRLLPAPRRPSQGRSTV